MTCIIRAMPEAFWLEDPLVLLHPKYLHRFFPTEKFHTASRMNSIVRASFYISISMILIQRQISWLLLPLLSLGITASWMYNENPNIGKKSKDQSNLKKDSDVDYLVSVILDGHPMDKTKKRKHSRAKKTSKGISRDLFRDTDDIMQEMQEIRARDTDAVGGRVPDTPNFARKLLGMNR